MTVNGAQAWSTWYNQPTGQFYHVATDNRFPYRRLRRAARLRCGGRDPAARKYADDFDNDFHPIDVGGEIGFDRSRSAASRSRLRRYGYQRRSCDRLGAGRRSDARLPDHALARDLDVAGGHARPSIKCRSTSGARTSFARATAAKTWQIISPDLSRANEGTPRISTPPTLADNNGVSRHGVVYAIAPSPLSAGIIWAGTDDGNVWVRGDSASAGETSPRPR